MKKRVTGEFSAQPAIRLIGGTGIKASTAKEFSIHLEVDKIDPNPFQPRVDITKGLAGLTDSIKMHGIIEPIIVRPEKSGRYTLVAGQRRLLAAKRVGLNTIPAVCRPMPDTELQVITLIENVQREDLNAVEMVRAVAAIYDTHKNATSVAYLLGWSISTVKQWLRFRHLSDTVLNEIAQIPYNNQHMLRQITELPEKDRLRAARRYVKAELKAATDRKRTEGDESVQPGKSLLRQFRTVYKSNGVLNGGLPFEVIVRIPASSGDVSGAQVAAMLAQMAEGVAKKQ